MTILALSVLLIGFCVMLYMNLDLHRDLEAATEQLEQAELDRDQCLRAMGEMTKMVPENHVTAAEIVKEVHPKRIKLRKSLSDLAAEQEASHRTKEKAHLDITRNMEVYGVKDLAMKQKEK